MNKQSLRPLPNCFLMGVFLMVLTFTAEAHCELITVRFSGTLTTVFVHFPQLQGFDFPEIGDRLSGFYKFDSTAQDVQPHSDQGLFITSVSDTAVSVRIEDFQFEGATSVIGTYQNVYLVGAMQPFELTSNPALAEILEDIGYNRFSLLVEKDNLYSNPNMLPLSPPTLDGALRLEVAIVLGVEVPPPLIGATMFASLDSLTVVPEPSGFVLLGLAFTLLLKIRPRRPC
ncbi:MAG: hypothetical protein WD971_10155 [Pirellulales bacterium]